MSLQLNTQTKTEEVDENGLVMFDTHRVRLIDRDNNKVIAKSANKRVHSISGDGKIIVSFNDGQKFTGNKVIFTNDGWLKVHGDKETLTTTARKATSVVEA